MNLAVRPRFDRIVLLCPTVPTGGPEALHQLSDCLLTQGADVHIAYYDREHPVAVGDEVIRSSVPGNPTPPLYREYRVSTAPEIPVTPRSLMICPEVRLADALEPRPFLRAVWWLSVNNAITMMPELSDLAYRRTLLGEAPLLHFHQSDYARTSLIRSGVRRSRPLSDYTHRRYAERSNPTVRDGSVAYFPAKGRRLATAFFDAHPDLRDRPIHGMSPSQVRDTLLASDVYVDFGHHPGKDRVPREAAMAGNVLFLHEKGAAANSVDHPLDPSFLFSADDVADGSLHERIVATLSDPDRWFARQSGYRSAITVEQELFTLQVRSEFFEPVMTR